MKNRAKYYNELYSVDASVLPKESDILFVPSPLNVEENAVLFPQDPSTGQLVDLLSQVLQTDNPLIRDSLLSKLETLPPSSSALSGVDDDIKIQLLKPRSCQSLSEMADFASYVGKALEQLNVDPNNVDPNKVTDPDPDPDPDPESNE